MMPVNWKTSATSFFAPYDSRIFQRSIISTTSIWSSRESVDIEVLLLDNIIHVVVRLLEIVVEFDTFILIFLLHQYWGNYLNRLIPTYLGWPHASVYTFKVLESRFPKWNLNPFEDRVGDHFGSITIPQRSVPIQTRRLILDLFWSFASEAFLAFASLPHVPHSC